MTIYLTSSPKLGCEGMQRDVLFNCSYKLGELSAGLRGMSITYYLSGARSLNIMRKRYNG